MDSPSPPGSYPIECTNPLAPDPAADNGRRRLSSTCSNEILSMADRLHLEVYFESRSESGYGGQLAGFLLGIVGFIFVSALLCSSLC